MLVIPRESPVFANLNSYYVNIPRCVEHFQGELGAGCIHFRSNRAEGVLFFDQDDVLSGAYREGGADAGGREVVEALVKAASRDNFVIDVHRIDADRIYFWSRTPEADALYRGLDAEFTDLDALIRKMNGQKLTGMVEVSCAGGTESSLLYFTEGTHAGGSHSWPVPGDADNGRVVELLLERIRSTGGIFNVYRIPTPASGPRPGAAAPPRKAVAGEADVRMVEELLVALDRTISSERRGKVVFDKLLKRKFLEKAERFAFLDPFAAQFDYKDGRVAFRGSTTGGRELTAGVLESVSEILAELGKPAPLSRVVESWRRRHADRLRDYGFSV